MKVLFNKVVMIQLLILLKYSSLFKFFYRKIIVMNNLVKKENFRRSRNLLNFQNQQHVGSFQAHSLPEILPKIRTSAQFAHLNWHSGVNISVNVGP